MTKKAVLEVRSLKTNNLKLNDRRKQNIGEWMGTNEPIKIADDNVYTCDGQ